MCELVSTAFASCQTYFQAAYANQYYQLLRRLPRQPENPSSASAPLSAAYASFSNQIMLTMRPVAPSRR
ncbi:MAG: hypothetical protein ACFNLD_04800 [Kingella oralis]